MNSSSHAAGNADVTQTAHTARSVPPPPNSGIPSTRRSGVQADAAPGTPRVDLYEAPHKTLRYMLANVLVSMGQATFADRADVERVLAELSVALWACDGHIAHEDKHVRPALAERAPNTLSTLDREHEDHAQHVAELRALMRALDTAGSEDARTSIGSTLYLHVSVFVAETLAHMAYEERVVQPLLDRFFTSAELEAIHTAIIADIEPQDMVVWLRAMLPAGNRASRLGLLSTVKEQAPPDVFAALLADIRPRLRADDWSALVQHFGL